MKTIFICVVVLVLDMSCSNAKKQVKLPDRVRQTFSNRFEPEGTGLGSRISLNGYYRNLLKPLIKSAPTPDTITWDILFYEDGSCITGKLNYMLDNYAQHPTSRQTLRNMYKTPMWGIYRLELDTIFVQFAEYPWGFRQTSGWDQKYILHSNMVSIVVDDTIHGLPGPKNIYSEGNALHTQVAKFIPMSKIPPPKQWMKTQRFFWRTESDWEMYMNSKN